MPISRVEKKPTTTSLQTPTAISVFLGNKLTSVHSTGLKFGDAGVNGSYSTILEITSGNGYVNFCGIYAKSGASDQSMGLKITIDGVVVEETTLAAIVLETGFCSIGGHFGYDGDSAGFTFQQVPFAKSLKIEAKTRESGAGDALCIYNYQMV